MTKRRLRLALVLLLAESWKLLDELTWQFKLRRGVVFHNREPFTGEAVRATVDRVFDPNQKVANRANIAEIVRVEVIDEATVNIVTQKPYAPTPSTSTRAGPAHVVAARRPVVAFPRGGPHQVAASSLGVRA